MPKRIVVPFGPQHPVLPEPIHLDLVLEDEKVVDVIPSIGYIHRGLSVSCRNVSTEYVYVAERICGICSFMHALCYCQGIEHIMEIEVPDRARYLRTIWSVSRASTPTSSGSGCLRTLWALRTSSCGPGAAESVLDI